MLQMFNICYPKKPMFRLTKDTRGSKTTMPMTELVKKILLRGEQIEKVIKKAQGMLWQWINLTVHICDHRNLFISSTKMNSINTDNQPKMLESCNARTKRLENTVKKNQHLHGQYDGFGIPLVYSDSYLVLPIGTLATPHKTYLNRINIANCFLFCIPCLIVRNIFSPYVLHMPS